MMSKNGAENRVMDIHDDKYLGGFCYTKIRSAHSYGAMPHQSAEGRRSTFQKSLEYLAFLVVFLILESLNSIAERVGMSH